MKGKLITFEGSEGSGKSTQIGLVRAYLKKKNQTVVFVREPGGAAISEDIRQILLDVKNTKMGAACETLLYMAARAQLVEEFILPALRKGAVVLCDRFLDSTIAYQGYGNGVDLDVIRRVGHFATVGVQPDLTFFFDIRAEKGLSRITRPKDRIERRAAAYHRKVRRGYLALARQEPGRVKRINADQSKEDIFKIVQRQIDRLLKFDRAA